MKYEYSERNKPWNRCRLAQASRANSREEQKKGLTPETHIKANCLIVAKI